MSAHMHTVGRIVKAFLYTISAVDVETPNVSEIRVEFFTKNYS